jgi:transposase
MQEVIPVKKRMYRRVPVKEVAVAALCEKLAAEVVVVALDVAKHDMVAAFATVETGVVLTVGFRHPDQSQQWLDLLRALQRAGKRVEVVMEPSGSYGDALRHQLRVQGVTVYRVGSKRTHDAAELFDAVPSMHDAKAAAVLVRLHHAGLSTPWVEWSDSIRELKAALSIMDLHHEHYLRNLNVLEALLARHWPELLEHLELTSASVLALLGQIGGPSEVAAQPEQAQALLRSVSRGLMKPGRIEAAVGSAPRTLGAPLLDVERTLLRELAQELYRTLAAYKRAKQRVASIGAEISQVAALSCAVGKTTAAVLVAEVGDPRGFACANAYAKAIGINLREKSSGAHRGRLSFTKRGSSRARKYLWFAVLRWVQADEIVRAYYKRKVARDGGQTMPALGALMRKLVKALFHVARGEPLDATKLFDVSRLELPAARSSVQPRSMEVAM